MSKAIVIKKNGVNQNLTVDKLRTNGADGQSIDWVPEDTVQLVALNATANGTYTPTGGKYGFEYATVSVPGSVVTGKKPDGNTYVYTKDGSGVLVETKVPSEIRITTMPTNVGPYGQGAYLDFSGIVVKAYYADGTEYGEIPYNELAFPVKVAPENTGYDVYDYGDYVDSGEITIQGVGSIISALKYAETMNSFTDEGVLSEIINELIGYEGVNPGYVSVYVKDSIYRGWSPISVTVWGSLSQGDSVTLGPYPCEGIRIETYGIRNEGETDIKITDYMIRTFTMDTLWEGERYRSDGNNYQVSTINAVLVSNAVQIPVQWSRPGDGMVLETAFGISVIPSMSSSN